MNTTENNKLLAEFIGYDIQTDPTERFFGRYRHPITKEWVKENELSFDTDWNSLMRVAEKIEQTETKDGRTFTIAMHKDNVIINQYGKYDNKIIVTGRGTRIENLYRACIEFVEWWKQEQLM